MNGIAKTTFMKPILILTWIALLLSFLSARAQLSTPTLLGYWHNWNDASAPYFSPDQSDSRYNSVALAFAIPRNGTDYDMVFTPTQVTEATLKAQIQNMKAQGRKVIISIGGANHPIALNNTTERDVFVNSMLSIINNYGFDGLDIDVEGGSLSVTAGTTIANPTDAAVVNMISAIRSIMQQYRNTLGRKLLLTMAPETAYVQGGMSSYGGVWGAYLPVIHALRDSIDMIHVQLYNSGTMYGIDRRIYTQGTADFIVAMTEAMIQGFQTNGGFFTGLPADKVAVGLPACSNAAGGGYTAPATVKAAVDYLRGTGPKPGTYSLVQPGGYSNLRGMMTWSINWDRVSTCGASYEFAQNFQTIFGNGGTPTCPAPASPTFSNINTTSATATWTAVSGANGYLYRYKPLTATTFTEINVTTNNYTMTGLAPATTYVAEVQATCSGGNSLSSGQATFTTASEPGTCLTPAGLTIKNIKFNSATASWNAVSGATSYELQYKVKSAASWTVLVTTGTSLPMSGLAAATIYEVKVRTICPGSTYSSFGATVEFTTPAKGGRKSADVLITLAPSEKTTIELSPNPVSNQLWIKTSRAYSQTMPYRIVNVQGIIMKSGYLSGPVTMLSVGALPSGLYIVQANGESQRFLKLP